MSIDTAQEVGTPMIQIANDPAMTPAEMVANSERRWRRHEDWVLTDPLLHPVLKEMFRNRTLCNSAATAKRIGVSDQRGSLLRTSRRKPSRPQPHPVRLPAPDDIAGMTAGVPDYANYQGILDLFRWQTRRGLWKVRKLAMETTTPNLHGRPPGAKNKPKDE